MFDRDYLIKGKHASYAKFLRRPMKDEKTAGVFDTIIQIYNIAPLIGLAYNRKAEVDNSIKDSVRIFSDAFKEPYDDLMLVYRLVVLSDESLKLSEDEKVQRLFKYQDNEEMIKENMDLYHQYMRGGIEWLYENIAENGTSDGDYLENLIETVQTYRDDFNII